jgi:hypothetical protein
MRSLGLVPHSILYPHTPQRNSLTRPRQRYAFRWPLYSHFICIPYVLVRLPRITLQSTPNSLRIENGEMSEILLLRSSQSGDLHSSKFQANLDTELILQGDQPKSAVAREVVWVGPPRATLSRAVASVAVLVQIRIAPIEPGRIRMLGSAIRIVRPGKNISSPPIAWQHGPLPSSDLFLLE